MGTATSSVEVCNLALDLLRQKEKVTSIETPESEIESLMARWYDVTRRSILRGFPWNFARTRAALSRDAVTPAFGYSDAYNLPNDYIELVFIGENYDEDYDTEYSVEGNQILIDNDNGDSLNICYIRDISTVTRFDPIFVDLLSAELAIRIANSITGINKSMKDIGSWKKELETKARAKNGHENPPKMRSRSPIIERRRMATRGMVTDGIHLFS